MKKQPVKKQTVKKRPVKKQLTPTAIVCPTDPLPEGDMEQFKKDREEWVGIVTSRIAEISGTQQIFLGKEDLRNIVCEIDGNKDVDGIIVTLGCKVYGKDGASSVLAKRKMVPYVSSAKLNKDIKEQKLFGLRSLRTFPEIKTTPRKKPANKSKAKR